MVSITKELLQVSISGLARQGNLQEFFSNGDHDYLVSLSEYGAIIKPTGKSNFIKLLKQNVKKMNKIKDTRVVDGVALVQMGQSRQLNTHGQ